MAKTVSGGEIAERLAWILSEVGRVADRVPGVAVARQLLGEVERELLGALKARLDDLEDRGASSRPHAAGPAPTAPAPRNGAADESLSGTLQDLLERSMSQEPEQSRRDYYGRMLHELLPDEARILSALSDGTEYPLIHVAEARALGQVGDRLFDNASSVGKAAGVIWPEAVPRYVTHLRNLGLVEAGPEEPTLGVKYEILETDTAVRRVLERAQQTKRTAKVIRRTLRISELGKSFWSACQKGETEPGES